jgi:SAM-dependent methyltransferase
VTDRPDGWTAGSTYEEFMGRWSRRLAPMFVAWLGVRPGAHWLDVGCGTGAMTTAIARHADPASVTGCDPAEALIAYASEHAVDVRIAYQVAGAGGLPVRAGGYDCVTSLLALNFFPDPAAAVREMRSLLAPGGVISACVWDYAGRMDFLRIFWDVACALDPAAEAHDEGRRFPLCQPASLVRLFEEGGISQVRCDPLDLPTTFAGFPDYWRPLLGGVGPAPAYVAALAPERRNELAGRLERHLAADAGGAIALTARAWAVRGIPG